MRSNQDPDLLKAFAAEVKSRRSELAFSQEALAFSSGVTRTFVARLELGQTSPSLTTIVRLSEGLNVPPEDLLQSTMKRLKKERRARSKE